MSLFNKIDKSLCLHEFFEKNPILLHIFHVIIKIENIICTCTLKVHVIITILIVLFIIKVFEGINEEN
jgi:hypothetical protein